MRFVHPSFFLFLIPAALALVLQSSRGAIRFSSLQLWKEFRPSREAGVRRAGGQTAVLKLMRTAALILIIAAAAEPQTGRKETEILNEGVDIMLTIDTSGSMQALDFRLEGKQATRLAVVQKVVSEFIDQRPGDRLGMVVFGEEAFTQAPLTLDHDLLQTLLQGLTVGMAGDATAIGSAIGVSVNRLKDLKAPSKVIVLLTDGRSNAGQLNPDEAAELAATFGVKIYTIGVGTEGPTPFLVDTILGKRMIYQQADLDEGTLKKIAETTHARYFRATGTEKLSEIYSEINRLEKSEAKVKEYTEYEEKFARFLIPGLVLLLLETALARTVWRKIP